MLYVWKDEVIIIQNCNYPECLFWKFYECNQTFQDYSKSPTTYEKWIFQQYNWNLHTIKSAIIPHPPYLHIRQYSYLIFYPGTTSTQNILAYTYWPKTWLQKLSFTRCIGQNVLSRCSSWVEEIFHPGTTSTQNILAYTYWPKTWLKKLSFTRCRKISRCCFLPAI